MTKSRPAVQPVFGIIVGHGGLPEALREAAGSITGSSDGLFIVSNRDCSAAELDRRIADVMRAIGGADCILFVDMFGSSCSIAGARLKRSHRNVEPICGVNLPMLVRFLSYRTRLPFDALVRLMHQTGQDSVRLIAESG